MDVLAFLQFGATIVTHQVIVDDFDKQEWEQYAFEFADYSIYQTWAYQQVRAENEHQKVNRVVIKDQDNKTVMTCQVRIKDAKPLGLKIGYVQWGPLFSVQAVEKRNLADALELLHQAYVGTRVNVLRIVPNVFDDQAGKEISSILKSCGFEHVQSIQPYRTMIFPLDIDEKEMRSRLHRSWHRYLNRAEKNNIEIREGTDIEFFKVLEKLYTPALERKKFKGLDPREFIRTQQLLSPHEKMNIVVAYYEGQPVTAHATSHLGDTALGILAASNEQGLQCWASYIVWWRTLLAGKRAGMNRYDLGGIDPDKNSSVYQFKLRMGAEEAFHIGIFEASDSLRAKVSWRLAEKVYNLVRR